MHHDEFAFEGRSVCGWVGGCAFLFLLNAWFERFILRCVLLQEPTALE